MITQVKIESLRALPARSGDTRTADLESLLPDKQPREARVINVQRDSVRPELYRIRLALQNQLLELVANKPLPTNSRVSLSRNDSGNLVLTQTSSQSPAPSTKASTGTAPSQQTTAQASGTTPPPVASGKTATTATLLLTAAKSADTATLESLLPLNRPQPGRVLAPATIPQDTQPPPNRLPAQPAPSSAPPASPTAASPTTSDKQPQTPANNPSAPAVPPTTKAADTRTSGEPNQVSTPAPTQPPRPVPTPAQARASQAPLPPVSVTQPNTRGSAAPVAMHTSGSAAVSPPPATTPNTQTAPVTVQIKDQVLTFLAPRPIPNGSAVELTRGADGRISAQIVTRQTEAAGNRQLQEILQQVLRDSLPQQMALGDAFNQLRQLSQSAPKRQSDALGQVVKSMMGLFSVKPQDDAGKTAQVVQRQLQSNGLQRQPPNTPATANDNALKQQLGRLGQLAERLPPDARQQLQSLVNSIGTRSASHQAASLQHWHEQPDGTLERQYRLDLPVQTGNQQFDNAEIRISQHKRRGDDERFISEWTINLHFDIEKLGSIDARVSLQQEWQLSAHFWAERLDTVTRIRDALDAFSTQLNNTGFSVESLNVQAGRQPQEEAPVVSRRLVDLHT